MAEVPAWSYGSRAARRQREAASLQRLGQQVGPLVAAGDAASLARARALTNIEQRAEKTARYRAQLQARMREAAGEPSQAARMVPEKKKKSGGFLGGIKDVAEDVGGALKDAPGDLAGHLKGEAGRIPGDAKKLGTGALKVLGAAREYGAKPVLGVLTGALTGERRQVGTDANGNAIFGRFPDLTDTPKSLLEAFTQNPVDTYRESRKAQGEFDTAISQPVSKGGLGVAGGVAFQGLTDPLTYAGPGMVKGALRGVPAGVRASRATRVVASLLEQPAAVGAGGVAGSAIAADQAERHKLSPGATTALTLAGGLLGGVGGGGISARGVRQSLKDVDTGLARVQGRPGQRAAVGMGISDSHPAFEDYIASLEKNGVEWTFDKSGRVVIKDANDANARAESMASEAVDAWENRKGEWNPGGYRHFGDAQFERQLAYGQSRGGGGGGQKRKQARGGVDANRSMDDAERIWETLEEGDTPARNELMRQPWKPGTRVAQVLPDEQYRLLESSWEDLAKNRAAGEVESKRLAARLGVERANRFANEHAGEGMSPRGTIRDMYAEIEAAELFESKARPLVGTEKRIGAEKAREKYLPMVARSYATRLRELSAEIETNSGGGSILTADGFDATGPNGALPSAVAADAGRAGLASDAGPSAVGDAAAVADDGISGTGRRDGGRPGEGAAAGSGAAGGTEQVIKRPGKPDVRVLGERGKGRVVAFDWDAGPDVRVGAKVATPYGSVIVESIETTGTGVPQVRAKFERSNAKHGVLRSDVVLVRQPGMPGSELRRRLPDTVQRFEEPGAFDTADVPVSGVQGAVKTETDLPSHGISSLTARPEDVLPSWAEQLAARRQAEQSAAAGGPGGEVPPPRPPAPGEGSPLGPDPDQFGSVPGRIDVEGVRERPELTEPDWLKRGYEESVEAEHNLQARAVETVTALGGNPNDLPFSLPEIKPGLTKMDKAGNWIKQRIGIGVEEDPLATPALRARRQKQTQVNSQAARLGALSQRIVSEVFDRDATGRITSLPDRPTIVDLAAALPRYEPFLTPEQMAVMRQLQREAVPYSNLIRESGIDIDSRADVASGGGFYLPRGRAEFEGMDLPAKVPSGRYFGAGTKKGFEKEAVFATQWEGIEAGFEYPDIGETMQSYARDAGRRALDQYTSDYFKSLKMESGQNIAMSYADKIDEELRGAYQKQVKEVASIRGRLATAERRAGVVATQTDELDTALSAFATAAGDAPDLRPLHQMSSYQRRQAARLRRGQPGRRVSVDEKGNVVTHELPFVEADTIDRVVTAFEDLMPDSLDYADAVDRSIATTARRLSDLERRGMRWSGEADQLSRQLQAAEGQLKHLQPRYRAAVNQARKSTRGTSNIGFVQLTGRSFPIELANAANKWLQAERPPMGKFAGTTVAIDALNNLMRGLRATGDASFLGIQGLLTAVTDPKAAATATRVAWQSMSDPTVLGAYIRDFDASRAAKGLPTSRDWARVGGHIGGSDTEFAIQARGLTSLGRKVQNLPVAKQANRMFGYYGDTARLELMDTLAEAHVAKGLTLDEAAMTQIATGANLMTGWSPNTFGGSLGQLGQFAPRFFQSQLELLGNLVHGSAIEKSVARKSMVRLMGVAVGLTAVANYLSPDGLNPKEYMSPWRDPKDPRSGWNPNFLRFRVAGTDATILGPWDSLLRGVMETAGGLANEVPGVESEGSASYLLRTKASPALGAAWDLMSGENLLGEKSRNPEYFVRSLLPFSVSDLGRNDLNPQGLVHFGVGATGVKATPMSPTENLDRVALAAHGKDFYDLEPSQQKAIKESHPELWQRAVEKGSAQRQRREALRVELEEQQSASDANFLAGKTTREDWIAEKDRRRDELAARSKEIYGDGGNRKPKDALDRYFVAIDEATDTVTGEVDWSQVDAWESVQPAVDQEYIARNTGLNGTPLTKLYRSLTREYYELPRYRGYDANQARAIDGLYTAVNNLAKQDTKLAKMSVLKEAAKMTGADEATVKAVRRRIYGMLQETTDRAKWKRAHPESALFLGRGQLLKDEISAINGQVAA